MTMRNLNKKKISTSSYKEKKIVREKVVWCDGGEDYGHPLVYLNLTKNGKHVCPYCSKTFIFRK